MNLLHISDLGQGQIEVGWGRGQAILVRYPHPVPVSDPLSAQDREELRWYLEDYLQFPYGAERDRARWVEDKMAVWGESLFEQVFVQGEEDPDPRAFYQEAVRQGLEGCELCLSSEDSVFLSMPWELLRDPAPGGGYLALLVAGLFRRRVMQGIEARLEPKPGGPFRILLVIARPYAESDLPLSTVARPMLEAVRPLRPRVQLEVLRPPTFERLVSHLNRRRGFYDLVHFDGHGAFASAEGGGAVTWPQAEAGGGRLVFERADGGPQVVEGQELGQALAMCQVPLFVINACQSAQEGGADPFSSVAAQLVAVGAKGVVAMSYSVYAATNALFMGRFYQSLVEHSSLSEAVTAARQRLYDEPHRASIIGPLELRDWLVPSLYQQEVGYIPIPAEAGPVAEVEEPTEAVPRQQAEQACPAGRFGFLGRDYDLLRIERALGGDDRPWVLLTGIGGTGKTELAFGFARWYAETSGCPGGVFAVSFREKADFSQVVGSIMGYGTDFSSLPEDEQWKTLVEGLRQNACLLVWDNFETVAGYPPGASPLAMEQERDKLARFLAELRGGKSRVILTTRKPDEAWLGVDYQPIEIEGLAAQDAAQLAECILHTVGRRPQDFRDDDDYPALLRLLAGHPRSLEVVLPHLRLRSPADVIQALQLRLESLGDIIDASLAYGFDQLSEGTRRHLPFLGLYASYAHAGMIANFVSAGDEQQAVYEEVMGEALDAAGWKQVCEEAMSAGLIRAVGGDLYALHPTLPPFLRRRLASVAGEVGLRRLDGEFLTFYAGLAGGLFEGVRRGERRAVTATYVEQANLLRALRLAELGGAWSEAQAIAGTLHNCYQAQGRYDEWNAVRGRLLGWVGREIAPDASRDQADLWMFLLSDEADQALQRNQLGTAALAYHRILDYLLAQDEPALAPRIATVYHSLGMIAQEQGQFDQAGTWYRQALEINERLGLEREAAFEYHQLGNIAYEQSQLDRAEAWYRRALEISERLGLERRAADEHHQLGMIAQRRGQFDQARAWYRQALEIKERLGLEREAAFEYRQLGILSQQRGQLEQAEAWYRRALEINELLGLEREAAGEYHQLGMIAEERGQLDQAQAWYRQALAIFERLGLERDAASNYHQLGNVALRQNQLDQSETYYRQALTIKERLGLERESVSDYYQLGMTAQQRGQLDQAQAWYRQSLAICERLGLEREAASGYYQLGSIAYDQSQLDRAEAWYRQSLEIRQHLGLEREAASNYHQLGMVAQQRGQLHQAETWYRQALAIYERLGHPPSQVNTLALLGLLCGQQNRLDQSVMWFGRAWLIAATHNMSEVVPITLNLAQVMHTMGERAFRRAWRRAFPDQEPPLDVLRRVLEQLKDEEA